MRYMDYTFVNFKNKVCSSKYLHCFYNLHLSLKYTQEDEEQNVISFRDVSVQKDDNGKY